MKVVAQIGQLWVCLNKRTDAALSLTIPVQIHVQCAEHTWDVGHVNKRVKHESSCVCVCTRAHVHRTMTPTWIHDRNPVREKAVLLHTQSRRIRMCLCTVCLFSFISHTHTHGHTHTHTHTHELGKISTVWQLGHLASKCTQSFEFRFSVWGV